MIMMIIHWNWGVPYFQTTHTWFSVNPFVAITGERRMGWVGWSFCQAMMCLEMGSRLDRLRLSLICAPSIALWTTGYPCICSTGLEGLNEDLRTLPVWCRTSCEKSQRLREDEKEIYECMICMIYGTYTDSETCWFSIRESAYHFLFGSLNKCDVSTDSSDAWCNPEPWGDTSGAGLARSSDHHEAPTVRTATNVCCDTIITAPLSTTASASAITTSLILGKIYKIMFAEFPTLHF